MFRTLRRLCQHAVDEDADIVSPWSMGAAIAGPALMCADVAGLLLLLTSLRPSDAGWRTCAEMAQCQCCHNTDPHLKPALLTHWRS